MTAKDLIGWVIPIGFVAGSLLLVVRRRHRLPSRSTTLVAVGIATAIGAFYGYVVALLATMDTGLTRDGLAVGLTATIAVTVSAALVILVLLPPRDRRSALAGATLSAIVLPVALLFLTAAASSATYQLARHGEQLAQQQAIDQRSSVLSLSVSDAIVTMTPVAAPVPGADATPRPATLRLHLLVHADEPVTVVSPGYVSVDVHVSGRQQDVASFDVEAILPSTLQGDTQLDLVLPGGIVADADIRTPAVSWELALIFGGGASDQMYETRTTFTPTIVP